MSSDPHQDPMIGSLLDGRYHIVQRLGRGGMGNVYLAEETRLKRRCALKVLHPHLSEDRVHVERFLREAQMIAQLGHPNIVDIYAYGEEASGVVWFAMEMLIGEDLDARGKAHKTRPFSIHDCCAWGIQIAQAVAVVHQAGLIHRDLKTSNIFLAQRRDGEEIVKLLDFGIARAEAGSELTATGIALGTPSYMSPEQLRNGAVDRRSDVYSFGVLLFKMLTGRLPFTGDAIQVALAHCTQTVTAPSAVAPALNISPELDAVVLRAMAKDPVDRYPSMAAIEEALTAILHAEAPELAPAVKIGRTSQSQIRPVPGTGARPASSGSGSLVVADSSADSSAGSSAGSSAPPTPMITPAADAGTASMTAHATGPTSALALPGRAGAYKWVVITAGVSVLGIAAWLVISAIGRKDDAGPVVTAAPAIQPSVEGSSPSPSSVPPRPEPVIAPPSAPVPSPVEPPPVEPPPSIAPETPPTPIPPPPVEIPVETPVATPTVKSDRVPGATAAEKPKPVDPLKQIERKALACRRKFKAVDGPKITIDYAVGIDGEVTRSIPSTTGELGDCLAAAVQATQFEAKMVLGRKLPL